MLTFNEVSAINLKRTNEWHKNGISEWSVNDWAVAMGGEAGEVLNACKKLRRLETETLSTNNAANKQEAVKAIAEEIADTYLYLDLLAQRLGLNIEECIVDKFNKVSEREGFYYRLKLNKYSDVPDKEGMVKTAVFDGDGVGLCYEDPEMEKDVEPIDWPADWPNNITRSFLESKGFTCVNA